ncbi:NACHT domain-containing protein [Kocuria rosea]|uniref:NACHT domain-containing protein n=1 Tax=Kocuria rosea TaxID=1275 RepID=UPI00203F785C|nr:NACHT domain-containing protein [Kocuria rosea]MCM3689053.1 NACHT domain-containing protein [Kocuria rosea]
MSRSSALAGSLATVAIAALGGPLAMGGAALEEVVKYAQARYEEGDQSRQVRKKVTEAITRWARTEGFTDEEVERGLTLATETVARFGLSNKVLAELRFDPARAANQVVASAREKDRHWGTENHYEVAARSIQETYEALINQLQADHDVLIAVSQAFHDRFDAHAAAAKNLAETTHGQLGDLLEALVAVSPVSEVTSYLRTRIADWNVSVWYHDRQAAALERPLRVRNQANPATGGDYLTAEEALAHQQMLVVLGGPGAGKTWLARRYARQAAQTALSQLENGAGLEEVELPLLTTWAQWVKAPSGSPRESLVAASFASGLGHSDPGGGDIVGRLRRVFLQPRARVLLVVDSLDEAADQTAQASRLNELRGLLTGWRIVVTSRPAAWDATYRGGSGRASMGSGQLPTPRVVTLCDLTYPEDVEAFIRDWFAHAADPARGEALIREIRDRADLARVAVVPLMLTFYCLLAEKSESGAEPLPARRRKLYRRLARQLLRAEWTADHPGPDAAPDWDYCEELLRNWAWQAVRDRTNAVGLGVWEDSFTPPTRVRKAEARAIDHIAPKTAVDDEENDTRRFVHRTFLEHFVAEHIATLPAGEAADLLLPHLWFDPDWKVAAPSAIIAHNQQQPGTLLQHLLDRAVHPAPDPARQWARDQLDQLLLTIAQESDPGEWSPEHQDVLHQCRTRNAAKYPDLVIRSAHWTRSNPDARTVVLQALHTANWGHFPKFGWMYFEFLVAALMRLGPTEAQRAQARTEVLQDLSFASLLMHPRPRGLVEALVALGPTKAERAQARTEVLQVLRFVGLQGPRDLVGALMRLVPTEAERAEARTAALEALPTTINSRGLMEVLVGLGSTEAERDQARTVMLEALATASPWDLRPLVEVLVGLGLTAAERTQARTVVLGTLSAGNPGCAKDMVEALVGLVPTEAEQTQARTEVLQALPTALLRDPRGLVEALVELGATEDERGRARAVVLQALPNTNSGDVTDLVEALMGLGPTEAERGRARTAVLQALLAPDPQNDLYLVEALVRLGPTEAERAQARTAVLQTLPTADPGGSSRLVVTLVELVPTEAERTQARTAVLQALLAPDPQNVPYLVEALVGLGPTEAQRAQARTVVLQALLADGPWHVSYLVKTLMVLGPTEAERAQARTVVLQALLADGPGSVADLVETLVGLVPTEPERDQARSAVLRALPHGDPRGPRGLVEALRVVSSVESWLAWLSGGPADQGR